MVKPLCGNKKPVLFIKTKDFSNSGKTFSIMRCPSTGLLFTSPIPKNINSYYDKKKYDSYKKSSSFFGFLYGFIQRVNGKHKLNLIKKGSSLLDYGAGSGFFVNLSLKAGVNAVGYEPINKLKNKNVFSKLKDIGNKKFDYITMWHVLEHTPDPLKILVDLRKKLKNNGKVIIALPNTDSYDNTYYNKHWAGYDVPRHLYHFNRSSFGVLCKKAGFQVIKTKPLYFDSFYVSMLSEKYKKNILWPLFGFAVGLLSNIIALFTKNHSSIIYIIK